MKAIKFIGDGEHELVDLPEPDTPPHDAAVVRVERAGICGSDLHILSKPMRHPAAPGIILGHEFTGQVVASGRDVAVQAGDRVGINPNRGCGSCVACRSGRPTQCPDARTLGIFEDGGFVEFAVVPDWALVKIPDRLSWNGAAVLEPLSCIVSMFGRVALRVGDTAAVLGAGPMGLLSIGMLAASGVSPIVCFEPSEYRRSLASRCGATQVLDASELTPESWAAATGVTTGPDYVVESVGHLLDKAVGLVAPCGTVLQVGYNSEASLNLRPHEIVDREVKIIGAAGNEGAMERALAIAERELLPLDEVVTHVAPIDQFDACLARMRHGQAGKVLLTFR